MCQNSGCQCEPLLGPCAIAPVMLSIGHRHPPAPKSLARPSMSSGPCLTASHRLDLAPFPSGTEFSHPISLSPSRGRLFRREGLFAPPPCPHSARVASREGGATELTTTSETAAKRKVSTKRRPAHILSPFGLKDPRLPAERALPAARPMQSG